MSEVQSELVNKPAKGNGHYQSGIRDEAMATQTAARQSDVLIKNESKVWWQTSRAQIVGAALVLALTAGFVVWWFLFRPYVSTDDARVAATLVRLAPARVSGHIIAMNVDVGSKVTKGEVLAEIDHQVAKAELEKAQAENVLAQREFKRVQQLVNQHSLPPRELDKAQAQASISDAVVKLAQVNLENTYIRAPFDGVVVQKSAEVGNMIEPGQTVFTVADMDHAWIAANVEETSVGPLRVGQPVSISVDEGMELKGHVIEIGQATAAQFALIPSDNGSGNFTKVVQRIPIKVAIDSKPSLPLRVGESVEISIKVR